VYAPRGGGVPINSAIGVGVADGVVRLVGSQGPRGPKAPLLPRSGIHPQARGAVKENSGGSVVIHEGQRVP
jgi:hypothetical protein